MSEGADSSLQVIETYYDVVAPGYQASVDVEAVRTCPLKELACYLVRGAGIIFNQRLLKENHKRAAEEAANPTKKIKKTRKKPIPKTSDNLNLFLEEP